MKRALIGRFGAIALLAAACIGADDTAMPTLPDVSDTAALGVLPEPPTTANPPSTPPTVPPSTTEAVVEVVPITAPVGELADGDRLLLIGDTAMLSLTPRHEGIACAVLSGMGWQVEIEAEPGRYIEFAARVVDQLVVDAGERWDVIGLMFGQHLDTTPDEFGAALDEVLATIGDVPVLLYTRSEIDDATAAVNEVIRDLRGTYPNVLIVDWGAAVVNEQTLDLVADDGLPTADGMERITLLTAGALGRPAVSDGGQCLEAAFTDDSAIVL